MVEILVVGRITCPKCGFEIEADLSWDPNFDCLEKAAEEYADSSGWKEVGGDWICTECLDGETS